MKHQISIIIPVYDEASIIHRTISDVQALEYDGNVEIIIVDGNPKKNTLQAVCEDRVRTLASRKGRALQMNRGADVAQGEILLFLHADTVLPPEGLKHIMTALRTEDVVAGAFDLGIQSDKRVFRMIEKMVFYRTRLTKIPYGDQAIFIKRKFFEKIGGYKEIPVMEDVELMRRIKSSGSKTAIIPHPVLTSPRRWEKEGVLYCTLRNWILAMLYLLGVPLSRLSKFYG